MNWKRYGVSALNALISGISSSIASFSAASILGVSAKKSIEIAVVTAVVSGVVSLAKWIAQHPLPGADTTN